MTLTAMRPEAGRSKGREVSLRRGYLGQPDDGLHRLDLAEERTDVAELVVPPVVEQACGLRGDPPVGTGQPAPLVHAVAHALDHPHQLVLLPFVVRPPAGIIEAEIGLFRALLAGGGDRRDEGHGTAAVDDAVGGLPVLVQLPVPRRVLVRRVQDRLFEKPRLRGGILPHSVLGVCQTALVIDHDDAARKPISPAPEHEVDIRGTRAGSEAPHQHPDETGLDQPSRQGLRRRDGATLHHRSPVRAVEIRIGDIMLMADRASEVERHESETLLWQPGVDSGVQHHAVRAVGKPMVAKTPCNSFDNR